MFEGAIRNFPSPDVEKDNVNYLAGVREIGVRSEYTDGRDMPRLLIRSVEFEGPFYETWPPPSHRNIFVDFDRKSDLPAYARKIIRDFATRAYRRPITAAEESALMAVLPEIIRRGTATFEESVKDALQVVLTSPQFLFLVENSKYARTRAAGQLRTGFQAVVLPVERAAGSHDAAASRERRARKQLDAEVEPDDRRSAFLPVHRVNSRPNG